MANVQSELVESLRECVQKHKDLKDGARDIAALRASLRDIISKSLRSRLSFKAGNFR